MAFPLEMDHQEAPNPTNPKGFRGIGESGTIPVPGVVCSAVEEALRRAGLAVQLTELPLTPDRLHRIVKVVSGG